MKMFHDTNVCISVEGKEYQMEILEIPMSNNFSVDIKGMDKFILLKNKGNFMSLAGQGMTPELLTEIGNYINRHV
jgi:hypothetical protein